MTACDLQMAWIWLSKSACRRFCAVTSMANFTTRMGSPSALKMGL